MSPMSSFFPGDAAAALDEAAAPVAGGLALPAVPELQAPATIDATATMPRILPRVRFMSLPPNPSWFEMDALTLWRAVVMACRAPRRRRSAIDFWPQAR